MECFRCGICCQMYQPCLDLQEARSIASRLGMTLEQFITEYSDPRWPGKRNLLLRKKDDACIFLERVNERLTRCLIHEFRPSACRQWQADPTRPECARGLRLWGLIVDDKGRVSGSQQAKQEFAAFLASLQRGDSPT